MKKIFSLFFTLFLSTSFVSSVLADTTEYSMADYYSHFDYVISDISSSSSLYASLIDEYEENYASDYPFFLVHTSGSSYTMYLYHNRPTTLDYAIYNEGTASEYITIELTNPDINTLSVIQSFNGSWQLNTFPQTPEGYNPVYVYSEQYSSVGVVVSANFDLPLTDLNFSSLALDFPDFSSSLHNIAFQYYQLNAGDNFPTYLSLYEGA